MNDGFTSMKYAHSPAIIAKKILTESISVERNNRNCCARTFFDQTEYSRKSTTCLHFAIEPRAWRHLLFICNAQPARTCRWWHLVSLNLFVPTLFPLCSHSVPGTEWEQSGNKDKHASRFFNINSQIFPRKQRTDHNVFHGILAGISDPIAPTVRPSWEVVFREKLTFICVSFHMKPSAIKRLHLSKSMGFGSFFLDILEMGYIV